MAVDIENIKNIGKLLTKGLTSKIAPSILQGALVELFKSLKLDVKGTTAWVEENKSLWDAMGSEHQNQIKLMAQKVGNINWLNADWAINALKDDFPAVASLFLGWRKAYNWLGRQLEIIKQQARQ